MIDDSQSHYIVAVNVFDSSKNKLLLKFDNESPEDILADVDLSEFIGGGYEIYRCIKLKSSKKANIILIRIYIEEIEYLLEVIAWLETFPLIEGVLAKGIYELDTEAGRYFEIKDLATLSKVYYSLFEDSFLTEEIKIVCTKNSISLVLLSDNETVEKIVRHPFTFFDFYCPICKQKVLTYKTLFEEYPECLLTENPCNHFIGYILHFSDNNEKEVFDNLGIIYQYFERKLYIKTPNKQWKKAILHTPPRSSNSYWNQQDGNKFVNSENRTLFIDANKKDEI